jgi:hypothetical protein
MNLSMPVDMKPQRSQRNTLGSPKEVHSNERTFLGPLWLDLNT